MSKNILLTVDLGDESSWKRALPEAVELTRASGGSLSIITVVPDFGMSIVGQFFPKNFEKNMAAKVMESLHNFVKVHIPEDIEARHIVAEGNVYECILNTAKEISADLIVVSSGRDDLKDFLLGPNAARIARHANCSVLVVRN